MTSSCKRCAHLDKKPYDYPNCDAEEEYAKAYKKIHYECQKLITDLYVEIQQLKKHNENLSRFVYIPMRKTEDDK